MDFFSKFNKSDADTSLRHENIPARPSLSSRIGARLRRMDIRTFLARKEKIGGLVIRERMVELALFERNRDQKGVLSPLFYQSLILPESTVVEGRILKASALRQALIQLWHEAAQFSLESVVVSVPSGLAQFLTLNFPSSLSGEQLVEAVELAVESSLPLSPQKFYYDWVSLEGHSPEWQEVVLGYAQKEDIDSFVDIVTQSGFFPIALETHSMSLARTFPENMEGRLVVFRETNEVVVAVCDQGLPHLQFQIPQKVLEKDAVSVSGKGVKNKTITSGGREAIANLAERMVHQAVAGKDKVVVEDALFVVDQQDKEGLEAGFKKRKIPPISEISSALSAEFSEIALRDGWMAVAWGAALRGLILRRSDTIISLMAVGTELAYERARLFSFVDFLQKMGLSVGMFFLAAFGGVFLLVSALGKNIDRLLTSEVVAFPEFVAIRDQALAFNQKVWAVIKLQEKHPRWEDLFRELDGLRQSGVVFTHLRVPKTIQDNIIVEGVAQNRAALLTLKSSLEKSPVFSSEPLSLPLLLAKENISFSLKLKLKEPVKFFP